MIILDIEFEDGLQQSLQHQLPLTVGRSTDCGMRIAHWRIAKKHFHVTRGIDGCYIEDLGSLGGTRVNGKRITRYGPLKSTDTCIAGPCRFHIRHDETQYRRSDVNMPTAQTTDFERSSRQLHVADQLQSWKSSAFSHAGSHGAAQATAYAQAASHAYQESQSNPHQNLHEDLHQKPDEKSHQNHHQNHHENIQNSHQDPLQNQIKNLHQYDDSIPLCNEIKPVLEFDHPDHHVLRHSLHTALIKAFDLRRHDVSALSDQALRQEAVNTVGELLKIHTQFNDEDERQQLIRLVVDEAVGLGVLERMLDDPDVTEIMVNRYDRIYVERKGRISLQRAGFSSEAAVRAVIDRIVFPLGRRIDESSPMVDARLHDGSRMNAVIPPISMAGACMTIRKFPRNRLRMPDLVRIHAMNQQMADLLALCVRLRLNILVSGGTGSGKTTLLNILGECIPEDQRVITIEDSAELQIHHPHVLSLEARPANTEGHGLVSIRSLVRNAMRMRPDRIIVGEVRGAEALDMLVAMNTGHEGSLTTLHANSPRDALARLETMILMADMGLPLQAIREQISSAIHLVIQQARLICGRRLITHISEISGMESGKIQMQTLMYFDHSTNKFERNPLPPTLFENLSTSNEPVVKDWFIQQ